MKTQSLGFLKAYKKVKSGKKFLSDKNFIKYKLDEADNFNSLGNFFSDEKFSFQKLHQIENQFYKKIYKLNNYVCVVIPKKDDDYRLILVPAPSDRILFSYILEVIKPNFLNEINKYNVFGSGKRTDFPNIKKIIEEIQKESKKHRYILKIDIRKFFPSINKNILFNEIEKYIDNDYIFKIIKKSFKNKINPIFTKKDSEQRKKEIRSSFNKGIPQGCAYSPLLANFYALPIDKIVNGLGCISFRYLDDMIIFTESEKEAKEIFKKIKSTAKSLKLRIHPLKKNSNKTFITKTNFTFDYLGIEIKSNGTLMIPLGKIQKEISLIKAEIFNQTTLRKFGAKKVVKILDYQFNGWKRYYQKNFPAAYLSMRNINEYNKQLEKYYAFFYYKKQFKEELLSSGFNIKNNKFYF